MEQSGSQQADEKPRRRGSGSGGGSKKSIRRKSGSSSLSSRSTTSAAAADARRDNARGYDAVPLPRESRVSGVVSGGGVAARADLVSHHERAGAVAQSKESPRLAGGGLPNGVRQGAKISRRGNGQTGIGSVTEAQPERIHRGHPETEMGRGGSGGGGSESAGSGVDRTILQRWRSDAAAHVAAGGTRETEKDALEVVEAEENTGAYDDDDFEDYSDEFDGEDDDGGDDANPPPAARNSAGAAAAVRPFSGRGGGGGGAVVSSALKMRKTGDVQAPDDKALEEIRVSLRQENMAAQERKDSRPPHPKGSTGGVAEGKAPASTGERGIGRGAKGAKGSRRDVAAVGDNSGGGRGSTTAPTVARGKFSVEESSAEAKTSHRKSGFEMSDAKALTRALAKGDPRTKRVQAIRRASRFEVHSARLFEQAPILPIDLYHRRLMGQPPLIRQAGSQTNDDARSVEVQTDEIVRADKEAQFHLGHDDTALENLMRRLRSNRRPPEQRRDHDPNAAEEAKGQQQRTVVDGGQDMEAAGAASATTFKGLYNSSGDVVGGDGGLEDYSAPRHGTGLLQDGGSGKTVAAGAASPPFPPPPLRLGKFLRQASVVMETLCEENVLHASLGRGGGAGGGRGGGSLFDVTRAVDEERDDAEGRSLFSLAGQGRRPGQDWEEVGGAEGVFSSREGALWSSAAVDAGGGEEKQRRDEDAPGAAAAAAANKNKNNDGLGMLLRGSEVVGVEFSRVKRSMLVTAHARPVPRRHGRTDGNNRGGRGDDEGKDGGSDGDQEMVGEGVELLEGCGLVCVWNTENIQAAPVSVLSGEGFFSCLCLALHQPHIVVTGTAEGCLLLWDLREPAPSARSAESRRIGLQRGIRLPTYTTAAGGRGDRDAGLSTADFGHTTPVVSVVPIPVPEGEDDMGGGGGRGGLGGMLPSVEANSFQLASLDDGGIVSIWLASEVSKADEGGSQTDLGLSPGGRVRLALSKSLRPRIQPVLLAGRSERVTRSVSNSHVHVSAAVGDLADGVAFGGGGAAAAPDSASARALTFSPQDPNRFLVGGSSDRIMHASRLGQPPPPRAYRPSRRRGGRGFDASMGGARGGGKVRSGGEGEGEVEGERNEEGAEWEGATGGVTCLAFSLFFQRHFLAGCGDGSVRLYKDDVAVPLKVWEGGFSAVNTASTTAPTNGDWSNSRGDGGGVWPAAVSSVAWSEHRPAVFFVLDALGGTHVFDLLEDDEGPVASEPCPAAAAVAIARPGASQAGSGSWSPPVSSPPALALSSETLATGSRPKVALAFRGRVFMRPLAGRVFRQPQPAPMSAKAGGLVGQTGESAPTSERERMAEWLRDVL